MEGQRNRPPTYPVEAALFVAGQALVRTNAGFRSGRPGFFLAETAQPDPPLETCAAHRRYSDSAVGGAYRQKPPPAGNENVWRHGHVRQPDAGTQPSEA